jgi:hypothetical protein
MPDSAADRAARTRRSPTQAVLLAGGVAAAIASIVGLGATVGSWFKGDPPGEISALRIERVVPLSYGQWRDHERAGRRGVPKAELATPGRMVTYAVATHGFHADDTLPVRIVVTDLTTQAPLSEVDADTVVGTRGEACGCADWVAIPRNGHRYAIEVQVFDPGDVTGQSPARADQTAPFRASPA